MEITGTLNAYVSPGSRLSPDELENPKSINGLMFAYAPAEGRSDYFAKSGYTLVGTAVITVTLMDRDTLVSNKIDALRNESASIRAEATAKCTKIEGQIQQLLCIENAAPTTTPADIDDLDAIPF